MKDILIIVGGFVLGMVVVLGVWAISEAHETTIYAVGVSQGAGYDPGGGVSVEYRHRWGVLGFAANGDLLCQKKTSADSGFKYGADAQARAYYKDFYVGAGGAWAGYDSKFGDGGHWRKNAFWPLAQVGYDAGTFDAWVSFYPEESQTPNRVSALKMGASAVVWKAFKAFSELSFVNYDQGSDRKSSILVSIGLGWKF